MLASARGVWLTMAAKREGGGRGGGLCISWSEGTKCACWLFCIFCLGDQSFTTDL